MLRIAILLSFVPGLIQASWYDPSEVLWNLNANKTAVNPLDYSIPAWPKDHKFNPSPGNWRFPFYSFFLDRFVNGDPANDNANGTTWEHDLYGTQLRHGGDIKGVTDSLDYLHGLGIRGLYIAGGILMNLPWEADMYSPVDRTLLDHHLGTVDEFREAIKQIHARGMYVIIDHTMSTMSNLFGFTDYLNVSAPWSFEEHDMEYETPRTYRDFYQSNDWFDVCPFPYPRFWDYAGHQYNNTDTHSMIGCRDSEFDQFSDVGAFGKYPIWRNQLSKFNGVQDRLREWRPSVLDKIIHFSCLMIHGLDIDGFRMDKAMQITVDPLGNFSHAVRECAVKAGKKNFLVSGEIVNGNADGAIYIGRGKEPEMRVDNLTNAIVSTDTGYIREDGHQALDSAVFHYTTYRSLERFLGLEGKMSASFDAPVNFQAQWKAFLQTNDMHNANTGMFDPRHFYGVSNQDVLRWPGLADGSYRQLLGDFIVTLTMPGIPIISWGEEQAFYTLDSTASNYVYGRQPMSSAQAWQMHGCYKDGDSNLPNVPFNSSLVACKDDSVSLDHRDPSHPMYTVLKHMFELRRRYPVLNDGWNLEQLSNLTYERVLYGSPIPTVFGLWSAVRGRFEDLQDLSGEGLFGNQPVWLLYSNEDVDKDYEAECDGDAAIISPFDEGEIVKNLFYPFDEYTLNVSTIALGIEGSTKKNGCLPKINMTMYGWKAFVPKAVWMAPSPMITKFLPGHDARMLSVTKPDEPDTIDFEFRFSAAMNCDSVRDSLSVDSTTDFGKQAKVDADSITCSDISDPLFEAPYSGPSPSIFSARGKLTNVYDGVHVITCDKAKGSNESTSTETVDRFLLRIGQSDNPIVFPGSANYSHVLLFARDNAKRDTITSDAGLYIQQKAAGADKWRYSMSFGARWSEWLDYAPGNASLEQQAWKGRPDQKWTGEHVKVEYWSKKAGSSSHVIEGDLYNTSTVGIIERRFPHMFVHGPFNEFGYDAGIPNKMWQLDNGTWAYDFLDEWPSQFQLNVWGMAANGHPDLSFAFGDIDNDTVCDRIEPTSLQDLVVNITNHGPQSPWLAWRILFNDGDYRYYLVPHGSRFRQIAIFILLAILPVISASIGVLLYIRAYYGVKFNSVGYSENRNRLSFLKFILAFRRADKREKLDEKTEPQDVPSATPVATEPGGVVSDNGGVDSIVTVSSTPSRRTVLIATMEYDISDWDIKVKIGGLGVMAQLMGKNLQHQDLIWVVPCVGDIEYPIDPDGASAPIDVTIMGQLYRIKTQTHQVNNITYLLLDSPVFRTRTMKEPYPPRMDDMESAIYYSAWNQSIAEAIRRFPVDLYHINDYHGTLAPLYILPKTIPCCLSLHNAEFQGLWPMRNARESEGICSVFNLPLPVVQAYVQFGEVFNLLHAGASILRIHQKGFGAVGVSKKYGKRSWARYPIFWGLSKKVGALPNPDPSDVASWSANEHTDVDKVTVNEEYEAGRAALKRQAQEWAGLEQRDDADLFVFVGRWSLQKGVDLIADVFPSILESYPHTQLICIGPVIDLYGKFAALKLDVMMRKYPGRVYSKPEFTALPPCIFSGAEFALIPSRDEPFGLVAVEFGRKGALGVGSRVGGLGQMPGWWYTIESMTTKHQLHQLKSSIVQALKADYQTRAIMRARAAEQRFPVAQWKQDLEILQATSIRIHKACANRNTPRRIRFERSHSSFLTLTSAEHSAVSSVVPTPEQSRPATREPSPARDGGPSSPRPQKLSLGVPFGPGHPPSDRSSSVGSSNMQGSGSIQGIQRSQSQEFISSASSSVKGERLISAEAAEASKLQSQLRPVEPARGDTMEEVAESADTSESLLTDERTSSVPGDRTVRFASVADTTTSGASDSRSSSSVVEPQSSAHIEPLAVPDIMGRSSALPQDLIPTFTDPTGLYYKAFNKKLEALTAKNSESELCIEEYLVKSEKMWFKRLHAARMSRGGPTPVQSAATTPAGSIYEGIETDESMAQFLLPEQYEAPRGIKRVMLYQIGDWPLYSLLLGLGQILSSSSHQITLLAGQAGEPAEQLYIVACVYLATTLVWWLLFRSLPSRWCLSMPWLFYGLAFLVLGVAPFATSSYARNILHNVAIVVYVIAGSSGSLFFAQNFGTLGAAPVRQWAVRACGIQGTQQIYVVALWAFGQRVSNASSTGTVFTLGKKLAALAFPVALFLWGVGFALFVGLPKYYQQQPGRVSDFYKSIFRRKIVMWLVVAVFLQNIFLSAQYGRTWSYLWSSKHAPGWVVFFLVVFFFVILWAVILYAFSRLSDTHTWILPLFAVALLCPRWAQELWSCSGIGLYLPWAGSPVGSALVGRSLFLWLGLLDSIQGIGIGMILLQTLARFHVTFALTVAQVVGSIATIIARADGLNSIGPGETFPNLAISISGLDNAWFWVAMLSQILAAAGYYFFFRKEQLAKP